MTGCRGKFDAFEYYISRAYGFSKFARTVVALVAAFGFESSHR
jgi:hypothetical protein